MPRHPDSSSRSEDKSRSCAHTSNSASAIGSVNTGEWTRRSASPAGSRWGGSGYPALRCARSSGDAGRTLPRCICGAACPLSVSKPTACAMSGRVQPELQPPTTSRRPRRTQARSVPPWTGQGERKPLRPSRLCGPGIASRKCTTVQRIRLNPRCLRSAIRALVTDCLSDDMGSDIEIPSPPKSRRMPTHAQARCPLIVSPENLPAGRGFSRFRGVPQRIFSPCPWPSVASSPTSPNPSLSRSVIGVPAAAASPDGAARWSKPVIDHAAANEEILGPRATGATRPVHCRALVFEPASQPRAPPYLNRATAPRSARCASE